MTFSILRLASASRSASACSWSRQVTPVAASRVAALGGAFAGPQNRRDHLLGGVGVGHRRVGGDVEYFLVDEGAVTVLALYQDHPDCRGCH